MSNRINPMDQGLLGKIGSKIGETGTTRTLGTDASGQGKDAVSQKHAGDTVELTSSAKLLERLEKTLASLPDVDSSRVESVKAQIENGEYQIDIAKIADALLRHDQELGD